MGFLTGGVLFGETYSFFLKISSYASYGQKTLAELLKMNPWILISVFVGCTLIFYVGSKIAEAKEQQVVGAKQQQVVKTGQVREHGTSA